MARFLRQSTSIIVAVGPFVSSSDGLTRLSALVLSATDRASIIKANTSAAALNISARTWSAIVSAEGHYALTVSATDCDTVGALRVNIADNSECLPVYNDFYVLEEAIYDALFAASAAAFDANQDVTVGAHAAGSFTSAAWAASAIISAAISAGAITSTGIADGAITSAEIAAGAIISATFAAGAINSAAIATDAIGSAEIAAGAITSAKFAASAIISATFSAGAIVSNAIAASAIVSAAIGVSAIVQAHLSANAIASAAISADAITKIQDGIATSAVLATVSTNVTSILDDTGTAGVVISANAITSGVLSADAATEIAAAVWDKLTSAHAAAGSFGQRLAGIRSGTAQAGTGTTIQLDAGASATDNFYNNCLIVITAGTGVGQARFITAYTGATVTATVATWVTNPGADSVFVIIPFGSIPGASAPTAAEVADAVWDEATAGHTTAGTFGEQAKTDIDAILADTGTDGVIVASINANAINAAAISADAITAAKISADAVTSAKIADGTITSAKFAASAIVSATIGANAIVQAHLSANAIASAVLSADAMAKINVEVVDALNVDTYTEIGQETPAATQTIRKMLAYLYKAWRNKSDQTASTYRLYGDDATTVDQKSTVSDDGTTYTSGEKGTGP